MKFSNSISSKAKPPVKKFYSHLPFFRVESPPLNCTTRPETLRVLLIASKIFRRNQISDPPSDKEQTNEQGRKMKSNSNTVFIAWSRARRRETKRNKDNERFGAKFWRSSRNKRGDLYWRSLGLNEGTDYRVIAFVRVFSSGKRCRP